MPSFKDIKGLELLMQESGHDKDSAQAKQLNFRNTEIILSCTHDSSL